MKLVWLIAAATHLLAIAANQSQDDYVYEIPYNNRIEDYPDIQYPKSGPEIDQMDVSRVNEPNQIRLSLTGDVTEMAIMWTTNSVALVEEVMYGLTESDLKFTAHSTSHQYDWNYKEQLEDFYYTSGFIHEALMINLEPGKRHFYQIESNGEKSEVHSFIAAPAPGSSTPISLLHIGDQGTFGTSVMVTKTMMDRSKVKDFHGLVHAGDISYADKYAGSRPPPSGRSEQKVWDTWGQMVQPLASKVPYMVSPGNHEIVGFESAWENGSIYNKRFIMPENERYYSFGVGMVRVISVSTDDHIDAESTQGTWLEKTLEEIDREEFPWVVVFQHRPIYNSNTNHGNWTGVNEYVYDSNPEAFLPEWKGWERHYEDLLLKYKVDFVLTGHVHHYERTWPVERVDRDGERVAETTQSYDNVTSPVHITCGHAGVGLYTKSWSDYADEDGVRPPIYQDDWPFSASKTNEVWGHCEMEFLDRHTAKHYMFAMGETEPMEEVTITKADMDKGATQWLDGTYGETLTCPDGYVATGACGSGWKSDCGDEVWTKLKCESEYKPGGGSCQQLEGSYGNNLHCPAGHAVSSLCGSGSAGDCGWYIWNSIECCPVVEDTGDSEWTYAQQGINLECKRGWVMTGQCGSGRTPDCAGGTYHGIQCTEIVSGCPYVNEHAESVYAQTGELYSDGCNQCICGKNGFSACTLMECVEGGCEYKDEEGKMRMAKPGESFKDDCNTCVCQGNGTAGCTKMACRNDTKVGCEYEDEKGNMRTAKPGESFMDDCNTCVCHSNGTAGCTLMYCDDEEEAGCQYVDDEGRTVVANIGETFSDGCNECECGTDGAANCTEMACTDKCEYKNWDMLPGWAGKKMVQVWDPKGKRGAGCPKKCKCRTRKRGKSAGIPELDCKSYKCEKVDDKEGEEEGEVEEGDGECDYNLMTFKTGDIFYEKCEKCECMADGLINCTEEACCLYVKRGLTRRAYPGEGYNDGCNDCTCGSEGGTGACTKKACPSKCSYRNWDDVLGYANRGDDDVPVYDTNEGKHGCPKYCSCAKTRKGSAVTCEQGFMHCVADA